MTRIKERKTWFALLTLLLLLAACKGETPTAPPVTGTPPGGSIPPTGATLTLTASNTSPIIDSTVTITATVSQNGAAVPNGTAVEFTTTSGTFTDVTPGVASIIRTTTNGVATVNLTQSTPGLARVTATVNNITRSVDVTFRTEAPCVPPDPRCPIGTTPTITAVTPSVGKPTGGELIRITGTNFIGPLRVLFDLGTGTPVQALITNSGTNFIDVITPAVSLGAGNTQQLAADVIVITQVGSPTEGRVVATDAFTFRNTVLTPIIYSLTPTSGPINGSTRVVIFGEGFQAPVQVFFGSAEAQVVTVAFDQIVVMSPDARSTNPNGSGTVTGPVDVRVVNINSNTRASSPEQFLYKAKMQITAISPLVGPAVGGTDVTIDGIGFDAPVQVLFNTSPPTEAQVIRVSGTQILVRSPSLANACSGGLGAISVTNIENGDNATSANVFTFVGVQPQILSATSPVTAGNNITAVVQNPGVGPLGTATIRFLLGNGTASGTFTIIPSPSTITSGSGTQNFSVAVPLTGFTFPSVSCTATGNVPGTIPTGIDVPLTFRNVTTECIDTVTVHVNPNSPVCVAAPPPQAQVTAPATGCAFMVSPFPGTGGTTVTFRNNAAAGSQSLTVTLGPNGGTNPGDFAATPPATTIAPGSTGNFSVTFTPAAAGPRSATLNFTTNDPSNPSFSVCVQGDQVAP